MRECPNAVVTCGCGVKLARIELLVHEQQCQKAQTECIYCKVLVCRDAMKVRVCSGICNTIDLMIRFV